MIPEDDMKPVLDPRIFCERKDKSPATEVQRQAAFVAAIRKIAPRVIVFAVPNSARQSNEKLRQYREGAVYGAADLICAWTGGVAFIEMKGATTMPRANQVEFLNALVAREHHVAVIRNAEAGLRFLRDCGAPVPIGD